MFKKTAQNSVALLIVISIISSFYCKSNSPESPDIKKSAIIQISIDSEPVYAKYNWNNGTHCLSIKAIISETNGVTCTIDRVNAMFVDQGATYENQSFSGGNIPGYGKLEVTVNMCAESKYEQLRISIEGIDSNENSLSGSEDFSIEYIPNLEGIYSGSISGTQNGSPLNLDVTFEIFQEGKELTGTWVTTGGSSGTVEGEFSGTQITADILQEKPCDGIFKGTGQIKKNGEYIKGEYSGTSSCSGSVDAKFTVYRE
jgi:hypothetical protein